MNHKLEYFYLIIKIYKKEVPMFIEPMCIANHY